MRETGSFPCIQNFGYLCLVMNRDRYAMLVRQRWFAISATTLLMAVVTLLWVCSFEGLSWQHRAEAWHVVFLGPLGWGDSTVALHTGGFPWVALCVAVAIVSHAIRPSAGTLLLTCLGVFVWFAMGWWTLASGI